MSQEIFFQLNSIYELIRDIHNLYIKYEKDIKINSFKSCGYGVDTISDIIQTNKDSPFLLEIKIITIKEYDKIRLNTIEDIFKYVLFLPIAVITPIGKWKFIDEPYYIYYSDNFSINLIRNLDLKLVIPSYIDKNNIIKNALFIPKKYINLSILEKYENNKNLDPIYLFYVFNESELTKLNNNYEKYFNKNIIGYEMCLYLFDNFIKSLIYLDKFDDKIEYKKQYLLKAITYFNYLKDLYIKKNIFAYSNHKYPERTIFYYSYLDYFNNMR